MTTSSNRFYRGVRHWDGENNTARLSVVIVGAHGFAMLAKRQDPSPPTKGLSQIVTPDLQPAGDLALSFQSQERT